MNVIYRFKEFTVLMEHESDGQYGISFSTEGIGYDEYSNEYGVSEIRSLMRFIIEVCLRDFKGKELNFYGFCDKRHRIFLKVFKKHLDLVNIISMPEDGDAIVFVVK